MWILNQFYKACVMTVFVPIGTCVGVGSHQNAANSVCGIRVLVVSGPVEGNLALAVRDSDVRVVFDQQLHVFGVVVERTPVQCCLLCMHTHTHTFSFKGSHCVVSEKCFKQTEVSSNSAPQ